MIPREVVEQILDTARIEEVIGDYVTLKRNGANLKACCPFHNEKTPSFIVSPAKGIFKCFGCGKSGNVVGFIMEHDGLSYVEALKFLAKRYHIDVPQKEESVEETERRNRNESLILLSEWAGKYFQSLLKTPEGQMGYAYFKSRGLGDDTIAKFGLGWAPISRTSLQTAAKTAGFKQEYLLETGLCFQTDDGKVLDRFHERVVFPIHSDSGRLIAFGCRTLSSDKQVAKYVNSPETTIYQKRFTLYGMHMAKAEVRKQDKFILVEGYLDVITFHQLGITNVAASSGTSLTPEQVNLIKRNTENVTIIYDGDSAGIHAALRGIGLILEGGLNVKVVLLPDGDDPDSFGRKHTKEEVLDFIQRNEQDFIGFKTRFLLGEAGNDPIKRASLINDIADTIALIPDAIKRNVYASYAANEMAVDEKLIFERIRKTRIRTFEEKKRSIERARENVAKGAETVAGTAGYSAGDSPSNQPGASLVNDDTLAPFEEELLGFILKSGQEPLVFSADSPYYNKDRKDFTVAEFIDTALRGNDIIFSNDCYRVTYNKYFELYEQGLPQDKISVRLLADEESVIRVVAGDIINEKYLITVSKFESSLTKESTALANFVPRSILAYFRGRVEKELAALTRKMHRCQSEEESEELMKNIIELNKLKKTLANKLGRI